MSHEFLLKRTNIWRFTILVAQPKMSHDTSPLPSTLPRHVLYRTTMLYQVVRLTFCPCERAFTLYLLIIVSFFLLESYVAIVCDSLGGDIVRYIPLLPDARLLEDAFSIYEKRDFATMVVFYVSLSIMLLQLIENLLKKF